MEYICAIDQGTTSTRSVLYDRDGKEKGSVSREHRQYYPRPGWVEHDPDEILENVRSTFRGVLAKTGIRKEEIAAVGITNQRETVVVWNRKTGKPAGNAVVWQDRRTDEEIRSLTNTYGLDGFQRRTGLFLSPYFSASKLGLMLRSAAGDNIRDLAAGTIDSWLVWNLTGGPHGGRHLTDVTNASRTFLMDIKCFRWDEELCRLFGIPVEILPEIVPSIPKRPYAEVREGSDLDGPAICGILGDQQAALFGQGCFTAGEAKCTYGTGCFLLQNTGDTPVFSRNGILTTPAYVREGEKARYALEGAVPVAGSLVQWLRDNLGLIQSAAEIEKLATEVDDNGGVVVVPAFTGLYAPYWDTTARGCIHGLTGHSAKGHIARAALEATAFQVRDVMEAIHKDCGSHLVKLRADGGMTANSLLMQFQADILGVPVEIPESRESTALGAAFAAGLCAGIFDSTHEIGRLIKPRSVWEGRMPSHEVERHLRLWERGVQFSRGWCTGE